MQVKVCPKCDTENKPDNAMCSNCYASLDGVAAALSKKTDEQSAAPTQAPSVGSPAGGPQHAGKPGPAFPTAEGASSPTFRERPQPVKTGSGSGIAAFLLVVIVLGGAFAAWWFLLKPRSPEQVMHDYFTAVLDGDYNRAKPYMTRATIQGLEDQLGGRDKVAENFKNAAGGLMPDMKAEDFSFEEAVYEGADRAIVAVVLPEEERGEMSALAPNFKLEVVLLKEDGRWKFDQQATTEHMRKKLEEMFRGAGGR